MGRPSNWMATILLIQRSTDGSECIDEWPSKYFHYSKQKKEWNCAPSNRAIRRGFISPCNYFVGQSPGRQPITVSIVTVAPSFGLFRGLVLLKYPRTCSFTSTSVNTRNAMTRYVIFRAGSIKVVQTSGCILK